MVTNEGLGDTVAASGTNIPSSSLKDCFPKAAQPLKSVFVKNVGWATQVRNFRKMNFLSMFCFHSDWTITPKILIILKVSLCKKVFTPCFALVGSFKKNNFLLVYSWKIRYC